MKRPKEKEVVTDNCLGAFTLEDGSQIAIILRHKFKKEGSLLTKNYRKMMNDLRDATQRRNVAYDAYREALRELSDLSASIAKELQISWGCIDRDDTLSEILKALVEAHEGGSP